MKAKEHRNANAARIRRNKRESAKRRRTEDPLLRAKQLEAAKQWYWQHKEHKQALHRTEKYRKRMREHMREKRVADRQGARQALNEWRSRNPGRMKQYDSARRARKKTLPNTFTKSDWIALCTRSPRCHWCKRPFNKGRRRTHDHVIALSKGGSNTLENSVCACMECNQRKQAGSFNPFTGAGILL